MNFWSNFKFTYRLFIKNISNSVMAVMVLSVGIALAVCMFTFINGTLWSSPKAVNDNQLVNISLQRKYKYGDREVMGRAPLRADDYYELVKQTNSFVELAAFSNKYAALNHPSFESAKAYNISTVTPNFFRMMGIAPIIGTLPNPDEKIKGKKLVISYDVWQHDFLGQPDLIGKNVFIAGKPQKVIAIMPKGFHFPLNQEVWTIQNMYRPNGDIGANKVVATLKSGVSLERAQAELNGIAKHLFATLPEDAKYHSQRFILTDYNQQYITGRLDKVLLMLLALAVVVLVIACANVSNIIMVRVAKRQHELAVRKSLGASSKSIIAQILLDALMIASLGGLLAILFSAWGSRLIWSTYKTTQITPYWWHANLDARVLLFAITIALLCAIISSFIPAFKVLSKHSIDTLKDDSRTSSGLAIGKISNVMVTVQIILATCFIVDGISPVFSDLKLNGKKLYF